MQDLLQPPVAGRVMGSIHGFPVLAQELCTFLLRQIPEYGLWVMRILMWDRLGCHAASLCPQSWLGPEGRYASTGRQGPGER